MSVTNSQSLQKRHVPMRRCVLCRSSKAQSELIRFYKTAEGNWELDNFHLSKLRLRSKLRLSEKGNTEKAKKPSGRGAWVCLEPSCHDPKKLAYFFKKQASQIEILLQNTATIATKHESTGSDTDASQSEESNLSQETKFHSGGMNV